MIIVCFGMIDLINEEEVVKLSTLVVLPVFQLNLIKLNALRAEEVDIGTRLDI
jgi:hypothetical protein